MGSYIKNDWNNKTWEKGQSNLQNQLNHMEDGIAEGGGGTGDYNALTNKPQLNGQTLINNTQLKKIDNKDLLVTGEETNIDSLFNLSSYFMEGTVLANSVNTNAAKASFATAAGKNTAAYGVGSVALGQADICADQTPNIRQLVDDFAAQEQSSKVGNPDAIFDAWNNTSAGSGKHFSLAGGVNSVVEGYNCLALGRNSHAEGESTKATGEGSHTEGVGTRATNQFTHAGGFLAQATGYGSFAHGIRVKASGRGSASFGYNTENCPWSNNAEGAYSYTFGQNAHASGFVSLALGDNTTASADYQLAIGRFNKADEDALFVIGDGTSHGIRHNIFAVKKLNADKELKITNTSYTNVQGRTSWKWLNDYPWENGFDGRYSTKAQTNTNFPEEGSGTYEGITGTMFLINVSVANATSTDELVWWIDTIDDGEETFRGNSNKQVRMWKFAGGAWLDAGYFNLDTLELSDEHIRVAYDGTGKKYLGYAFTLTQNVTEYRFSVEKPRPTKAIVLREITVNSPDGQYNGIEINGHRIIATNDKIIIPDLELPGTSGASINYVDTKVAEAKAYADTKDTSVKSYVDTNYVPKTVATSSTRSDINITSGRISLGSAVVGSSAVENSQIETSLGTVNISATYNENTTKLSLTSSDATINKMGNSNNSITTKSYVDSRDICWDTCSLTSAQMSSILAGNQLVLNLETQFNSENFDRTNVRCLIETKGAYDGTPIFTGETLSKIFFDTSSTDLVNMSEFIKKRLLDAIMTTGFDYHYYKTAVLYAGNDTTGTRTVRGLDENNIVYVQDVTQQKWEYTVEEGKEQKETKREDLEQEDYGEAFVFSVRGGSEAESSFFLFCLSDKQQAAYREEGSDIIKWANVDKSRLYPVVFDGASERWLLAGTVEVGGIIKGVEMSDAEKSRLMSTGILFFGEESAPVFATEVVEMEDLHSKTKCLGINDKSLTSIISINQAFAQERSEQLEYIARPTGKYYSVFAYTKDGTRIVEKNGQYVWNASIDNEDVILVLPLNLDESGKERLNTLIIQKLNSGISEESTTTIYRHTFSVWSDDPITINDNQYTFNISFCAVNAQAGDNSLDYILHSDESHTIGNPDWVLPVSGSVGIRAVGGETFVQYPAVRITATYDNATDMNRLLRIRMFAFDETTGTFTNEELPLITDATASLIKCGDFRSVVGTFKSVAAANEKLAEVNGETIEVVQLADAIKADLKK